MNCRMCVVMLAETEVFSVGKQGVFAANSKIGYKWRDRCNFSHKLGTALFIQSERNHTGLNCTADSACADIHINNL